MSKCDFFFFSFNFKISISRLFSTSSNPKEHGCEPGIVLVLSFFYFTLVYLRTKANSEPLQRLPDVAPHGHRVHG